MEKPPGYIGDHPGYQPLPNATTQMYAPPVMAQPNVTPAMVAVAPPSSTVRYGDQPTTVVCSSCNQRVLSSLSYENGAFTYLCSFGIALFFWCGCCLIPCCVDSCKDVHHYCPNCNAQLGIFKRL